MAERILIATLLLLMSVRAQATTADFNSLAAGSSYPAPALFSNGGLEFDVLYSADKLRVAAASSPANPAFTGNYLNLPSLTALNVNLPTGASQIHFDFIQNNSSTAVVLNGGWLDLSHIPGTINGIVVNEALPTAGNWGNITATGNIFSFVVVGTQFQIDNINVTPTPGVAGDYSKNQIVDASDYAVWRKLLNTPSGYNSWRSDFGATGIATSSSVPEPAGLALLMLGMQLCVTLRRTRRVSCAA